MSKKLILTALGASILLLAGCKAKPDAGTPASDSVTVTTDVSGGDASGFTKAQYMDACQKSMTETQCNCFVDFYQGIGLKVTQLGDSAVVQAAMKNLTPAQMTEMSTCME